MTDWQSKYEAGDAHWDRGMPSPGLVEFLEAHDVTGRILVPGCGFGHDVRAFAAVGAEALGLDIAPGAVEGAQAFPTTGQEAFELGSLFPLADSMARSFDWVWEHTLFCAIERSDRPHYRDAVVEALKPGGHYLAIFYMTPDSDGDGPPYDSTNEELDGLFNDSLTLIREWLPGKNYDSREGKELMRLYRKPTNTSTNSDL